MEVTETDRTVVQRVYEAMQAGPSGENLMLDLFTPDGVLVEPFSGQPRTHTGQDEIRQCYRAMMDMPRPPDFTLTVDRIWMKGDNVVADWTCSSQMMPAPLKGRDDFTIRDGRIERLEISLVGGMPQ